MMKFAQLATAVALIASAASASAVTTTNWGAHDPIEFGLGFAFGSGTLLNDRFSFTLDSLSDVTATAVANNSRTLVLTNEKVDLFKGTPGSGANVGEFSFGSTSSSATFSSLAAGAYYYVVTAKVGARSAGGSYTLTSEVSPVPEPETYALMLAGLAAGGFIVRRRRNR